MKVRFVFRPSESTATSAPGAIICRITVDKARKKFTTPISCLRRDWDAKSQRIKSTAKKARLDNAVLSDIEADINRIYFYKEWAMRW